MLHIHRFKVSYGSVCLGGDLGYQTDVTDSKVRLPPRISFSEVISAHAPAEILVEVKEPVSLYGALNVSAGINGNDSCEFWINDHWIGDLRDPCEATPAINLPKGVYNLRTVFSPAYRGAHALWLFNKNSSYQPRIALVTVACYPKGQVKDKVKQLFTSAARLSWFIHAFGANTPFESFYRSKIERLKGWLESLPNIYEYVIFLDAHDTFTLNFTEEQVYSKLKHPLLISVESGLWPEQSQEWAEPLKKLAIKANPKSPLFFINSGMICGKKEVLISSLKEIIELRQNWLAGQVLDWLKPYKRHISDDQFLWQAYYRAKPEAVTLDLTEEIFCTMPWHRLKGEFNREDIKLCDGKLQTQFNTEPCFVHFPSPDTPSFKRWFCWLVG